MRLAIISTTVFPCPPVGYSGLEYITYQLARGLARRGHAVTLIAPDGSHCEGCSVVTTGPAGQHNEKQAYAGWKARDPFGREMGFPDYWHHLLNQDAVIDHSWQKYSYALKAEGKLKAPVLGVCHAPINTMFSQWPPAYPGMPPVQKACPVCISEDQRGHFEALFNTPARTAYNGIDLDFYKPMEGVKRSGRFLFLARFSSVKSPDVCQDVCLEAGVSLDMVGDTQITNEPELLAKCKQKADGKRICVVGPATRSETVWWYSQAYALLHLAPNFREPFGLAPVEAQAAGCPVLCWNNGAMRETVKHGETGFIVSSVEEAVQAIKSGVLGDIDRKRCREWASQFSVEKMVIKYEQLCHEAVQGGW